MKAIVYREYGPPLEVMRLEEIERPVPNDNEVLVRVHAAAVNPVDSHIMTMAFVRVMIGAKKPGTPGRDFSGVVESVGKSVTRFKPGDAVFGGCSKAFAEYACAEESKIAHKPAGVTFEQAAALPVAGLTALQALRDKGEIKPGQKVLVIGASGGVGTFAVQLARHFGADVTGVCSTRNVAMVRGIGAHHVIDYTAQDFTRERDKFDLIVDLAGNRKLSEYRRVLQPTGTYVGAGGLGAEFSYPAMIAGLLGQLIIKPFIGQKIVSFMARINSDDLTELAGLVGAGVIAPVIDRRYALSEAAGAIQYVSEKRASGKVVIEFCSQQLEYV
jgi:NADPH:quinone reductase-like Zn-dependent oxidoreductase